MSADRDDDALNWAGDDDPTLVTKADAPGQPAAPVPVAEPALAPGWRVVGKAGRVTEARADERGGPEAASVQRGQLSSAALIAHGIFGGVFLLYTIGWLVAIGRDSFVPSDLVGQFMYSLGQWFAVLASALWFGATLWLTRGAASLRWRMIAFVIGVVVLVPWPFIVGAAS